jgi:hypothetical protein
MLSAFTAIAILPLLQLVQEGSEATRVHGDSIQLGGGIVRSWVDLDARGVPVAIGVTLPDSVIATVTDEGAMLSLDFPWMDERAHELHGSTFDQTIIYGSDGDRTIFVEPMFTSAFLAGRPDFAAPIPQPSAVREAGYYPTRYVIRHDPHEQGFRISLDSMRWRDGTAAAH